MITDTINTYPINNMSSFVVSYPSFNCADIQGDYFCDTDSLNDYGTIELSIDNGQSWIDLINDNANAQSSYRPNLTGNSGGWQFFNLVFYNYTQTFQEDSVLVKFSFISDSIDTQHDGIMFDNLTFCISTNTQNLSQLNNLKVFPNPTSDILNFQFEELIDNAEVRIYSSIGQLIRQTALPLPQNNVQFQVSDWQKGMYYYGIFVEGELLKRGQVLISE